MTISIGAATDYLYGLAQQAAAGVVVDGHPVQVTDGWPDELAYGMFMVGLSEPPSATGGGGDTQGTRAWVSLGLLETQEDYTIPCLIDIRSPGTTQKAARDLAEEIFNAFWSLLAADLRLGGLLRGGYNAEITDLVETPSNVGTVAEPGRRQLISFGVHCRNRTT